MLAGFILLSLLGCEKRYDCTRVWRVNNYVVSDSGDTILQDSHLVTQVYDNIEYPYVQLLEWHPKDFYTQTGAQTYQDSTAVCTCVTH